VATIWEVATGTVRARIAGEEPAAGGVAFSPDSRVVCTVAGGLRCQRLADGAFAEVVPVHTPGGRGAVVVGSGGRFDAAGPVTELVRVRAAGDLRTAPLLPASAAPPGWRHRPPRRPPRRPPVAAAVARAPARAVPARGVGHPTLRSWESAMGSLAVFFSAVALFVAQGATVIVAGPDLRPSQYATRDLDAEVDFTLPPGEGGEAAGEPAEEAPPLPPWVQVPNLPPWILGFPTAPGPATTLGVQVDTIGVQTPDEIGAPVR
jgi:hypothetical protein